MKRNIIARFLSFMKGRRSSKKNTTVEDKVDTVINEVMKDYKDPTEGMTEARAKMFHEAMKKQAFIYCDEAGQDPMYATKFSRLKAYEKMVKDNDSYRWPVNPLHGIIIDLDNDLLTTNTGSHE